ncbi:nuclear RNA export factor 1-like isoform X2 [Dendropsophus ebraccatus]
MSKRIANPPPLDGHNLHSTINFGVVPTTPPPCKGSFFPADDIKAFILRFLHQYYSCYDGKDRQELLHFYHNDACCSLVVRGQPGHRLPRGRHIQYFNNNRNLRRFSDPELRNKLLRHKRVNVVSFLDELPSTQHDLGSLVVDLTAHSDMMLSFVVNGVFKIERQSDDSILAFTRVFLGVPDTDGRFLIVNDQQFIRNATTGEIQKAFSAPAPTPFSWPVPVPKDMVQEFTKFSGMKGDWSQKCLEDNSWDFKQASKMFMKLKAEGTIPEVAFMKSLSTTV